MSALSLPVEGLRRYAIWLPSGDIVGIELLLRLVCQPRRGGVGSAIEPDCVNVVTASTSLEYARTPRHSPAALVGTGA
jgi:hypothetical protein